MRIVNRRVKWASAFFVSLSLLLGLGSNAHADAADDAEQAAADTLRKLATADFADGTTAWLACHSGHLWHYYIPSLQRLADRQWGNLRATLRTDTARAAAEVLYLYLEFPQETNLQVLLTRKPTDELSQSCDAVPDASKKSAKRQDLLNKIQGAKPPLSFDFERETGTKDGESDSIRRDEDAKRALARAVYAALLGKDATAQTELTTYLVAGLVPDLAAADRQKIVTEISKLYLTSSQSSDVLAQYESFPPEPDELIKKCTSNLADPWASIKAYATATDGRDAAAVCAIEAMAKNDTLQIHVLKPTADPDPTDEVSVTFDEPNVDASSEAALNKALCDKAGLATCADLEGRVTDGGLEIGQSNPDAKGTSAAALLKAAARVHRWVTVLRAMDPSPGSDITPLLEIVSLYQSFSRSHSLNERTDLAAFVDRSLTILRRHSDKNVPSVLDDARVDAILTAAATADVRSAAYAILYAGLGGDASDQGCDVNSHPYKRLSLAFVSYLLDDNSNSPDVSRDAFEAVAVDAIRCMTSAGGLYGDEAYSHAIRGLSLRASLSSSYHNSAGTDGFRTEVSLSMLDIYGALTKPDSLLYAGLELSLVDLLSPVSEFALRSSAEQYEGDLEIWANIVRPRLDLMIGVPDLSEHVGLSVGLSVRPVAPERQPNGMYDYTFIWHAAKADQFGDVNAGLHYLF